MSRNGKPAMKFASIFYFLFVSLARVGDAGQRIPALNSYDPGSCNNKSHGKEVLVKDRNGEEIILICVKEKDAYKWKPTDGTKNTIGDFFNPGDNCAGILDKLEEAAKDGLYWITLKRSKPQKVWCDMTTDGGGYMLVGRKNNSITWTVPSNDATVEPFGEPHWSSSLGDLLILDFRVQMATNENFKATKAHWAYRLKSKRELKNLMMITAGCDQRSAGIGNIAYVKDLMTVRVVTTKLRCSKFGFAYHHSTKFGWNKMNSCLQKPCPWGFAYPDVVKIQKDYYGAFSFSTTGNISGIEYKATAFVGCDNGYCCGCYGPKGGTKDYCAENCQAINGGTVAKNVFTWFWVRSSLPKRLWKKCMDYDVKRVDGKIIPYKLVGHSVLPVEGRCGKDGALLHDGLVVVPDSSSAQKVPAIDGLLEYRKDKQELYVRSNKTWNVLAKEDKIQQEMDKKYNSNLEKNKKLEQKIQQEMDKKYQLYLEKNKKLEEKIQNEMDKKYNMSLDKIEKLEQNLNNRMKIIQQEMDKKYQLYLEKNKKLEEKIQIEVDKKYNMSLDKIEKLEQNLNNRMKIVNQNITQLEKRFLSRRGGECSQYKWLRESNRNQKQLRSLYFSCDRHLLGWYRFGGGAGTKMPTSCVPTYRCGTEAPGWMSGAHPTVAEGKVTRKVCYHWSSNCCRGSNNIEVVNCGQYYVYKLGPTPGCHLRYCGSDN